MDRGEERFVGRLRGMGERARLTLEEEKWTRLAAYVALLFRWNEHMNLTALDSGDSGLERLVIEPLLATRHVPPGATSMVDIGSGGGSPAIPMKVARPELVLRMVESRTRKAAFLRHVVRQLNLGRVEVENCRYQRLEERPEMRQAHDILTVRGVRIDDDAARTLQGLLKPGGLVLAFCSNGRNGMDAGAGARETNKRWIVLEGTESSFIVARKAPVR